MKNEPMHLPWIFNLDAIENPSFSFGPRKEGQEFRLKLATFGREPEGDRECDAAAR